MKPTCNGNTRRDRERNRRHIEVKMIGNFPKLMTDINHTFRKFREHQTE